MELTYKSRARMLFTIKNTDLTFRTLITLTYPESYPVDGKTVKGHLKRFLKEFRRDIGPFQYVWFLEFQGRGAPHFHILADINLSNNWHRAAQKVCSYWWYKCVGSGDENHLWAGTQFARIRKEDGAVRYAAQYASKKRQKVVPPAFQDVGRFWGCSRGVKPAPMYTIFADDNDGEWKAEDGIKVILDLDEVPPYSTLFDKADLLMRRIPAAVKEQLVQVADWTGEQVELYVVND